MYSLASRSAVKRSLFAASSTGRSSAMAGAVAPRFYTSTMHDNDPELLELEKQRNLRGEQHKTSTPLKDAPGWNQHLATSSEANVKADRANATPEQLAELTIQYVKQRNIEPEPAPSSVKGDERVDAREASYERDEITGPLKGSSGSVKETVTETESEVHTSKQKIKGGGKKQGSKK